MMNPNRERGQEDSTYERSVREINRLGRDYARSRDITERTRITAELFKLIQGLCREDWSKGREGWFIFMKRSLYKSGLSDALFHSLKYYNPDKEGAGSFLTYFIRIGIPEGNKVFYKENSNAELRKKNNRNEQNEDADDDLICEKIEHEVPEDLRIFMFGSSEDAEQDSGQSMTPYNDQYKGKHSDQDDIVEEGNKAYELWRIVTAIVSQVGAMQGKEEQFKSLYSLDFVKNSSDDDIVYAKRRCADLHKADMQKSLYPPYLTFLFLEPVHTHEEAKEYVREYQWSMIDPQRILNHAPEALEKRLIDSVMGPFYGRSTQMASNWRKDYRKFLASAEEMSGYELM